MTSASTPPPIIPTGAPSLPLPPMTPQRQAHVLAQLAAIPRGVLPDMTPRARLAHLIAEGMPISFYATHDEQGALVYRVLLEPQPGISHDFAVYTWRRHAPRALAVVMAHWRPRPDPSDADPQ
jgi:hypothetical protein